MALETMNTHDTRLPLQPVVMAGGSGTRLWPLSRAAYPKQFLVLAGPHSLFQQAVMRLAALASPFHTLLPPLVVGNEQHRFLVLDQLRDMRATGAAVLLEPMGRNTAPALTLAALQALTPAPGTGTAQEQADPILVVTPADQTVTDEAAMTHALHRAAAVAAAGGIAILGVKPTRPETGFGYIRSEPGGPSEERLVAAFVEKPDLGTAQRYLHEGSYAWNAGIFVLRASTWLSALERFAPPMLAACRAAFATRVEDQQGDTRFVRPLRETFAAVPSNSVDYAVMEKCPGSGLDIRMIELDAGWSDLGAWEAVWQVAEHDEQGNATHGDALLAGSQNTLVHATSRLVTAVGLKDVVIVETPDAVLVADRQRSQEVKHIVGQLEASQRGEQALHRKVHRPWGWYDSIDNGPRFQVKRICVQPGQALSLQMHHHRAEHWIVVSGTAEVVNGEQKLLLTENQSTYIPLGQVHRLANPGQVPLEIIEVQSGSYLGEDDIVRFEDTYGRT
jgi:mannose-1-phosphate guanylyltransferase / mannose-6-phosphate isomerase